MNGGEDSILEPKYGQDIVLLAGAGASGYIGYPTLEMLLRDPELFDPHSEEGRIIQETLNVVEAAKLRSAVFEESIAKLREYQEMAFKLRTDFLFKSELGPLPTDVNAGIFERKWKKALTKCYRILINAYGPQRLDTQTEESKTTIEFLEELAKINESNLHVYTTNYDCSFQKFASNCDNLSFITHIDNEEGSFYEQWYYANRETQSSNLPRVFVHRLHGCIAWFHNEKKSLLIEEVFGAGENLEIVDDEKLHRMAIKLVTSQAIGINPAFLLSFNELYSHLETAKALIIWGYSFRDLEVLRTINNAFFLRSDPLPIFSLNPFLSERDIVDNIKWTLRDVPVKISPDFKPRKIDWKPAYGNKALVEKTIQALTEEVK